MRIVKSSMLCAAVLAVAFSGCAEKKVCKTAVPAIASTDARDAEIKSLQAELADAREKSAKVVTVTKETNELYPPNAEPGKCYARVLTPATYETQTEQMLKSEAGEKITVTPATYDTVTEKVLVKEASEQLITVPATFKTVTEKVLVKEASEQLVTVPAVYETASEQMLVRPAYTTWKRGSGPNQRVDNATGEIVCLVEVPAEYKTVSKQVLKTPASTKTVPVAAEYKTVTRQVVDQPASTKTVPVPAVYKTVTRQVVKTPATSSKVEIPATYQTVTKKVKVSDPVLKWQEVKCQTTK